MASGALLERRRTKITSVMMMPTNAYEEPLVVEVFDGDIVMRTGEGPFAVSLTPTAAAKTAENLARAARTIEPVQASQTTVSRD